MTNVVINLCGVKSKGGITVVNNYLVQNSTKNLYVLYDNLEFKKYIENLDTQILQSESTNQKFSVLETEKQNVIGKSIMQNHYIEELNKNKIRLLVNLRIVSKNMALC